VLSHERTGSGPPLLLLHGIAMRWEWWTPCLPALAARFDVAAVDFPGFGRSSALAGEPTPAAMTDAIESFCAELGWERPHVAGISMGGLVALELARRGSVASALAISPAGFAVGWERVWLDRSLRATEAAVGALAGQAERLTASAAGRFGLFAQTVGHPGRIPAAEAALFLRGAAESDFARTRPGVVAAEFSGSLQAPAAIAWGTRDHLLLPRQGPRAVERLPGVPLWPLGGCGHIPTYDDPRLTVGAVVRSASLG
jgi:pimeloyl-ACP methyl ester carboxylesterase